MKKEEGRYREEIKIIDYRGQRIWGVAYIPNLNRNTYPLVICSHALGCDYTSCMEYADLFVSHGLAAYCFDFRGGGGNKSDGSITDMSLITEASDIAAVIDAALKWDFVDPDRIILMGESQGGAASAITASRREENVNGLILCYPGFLIHDAVHKRFRSLNEVPASYTLGWHRVGRIYAEDVWNYDIYEEIGRYTKAVLLLHGDRDGIVPITYARQAAKVYSDVEFDIIRGGGHGFYGNAFDDAADCILRYLQRIGATE